MDETPSTKFDFRFAEDRVIFRICNLSLEKKFSLYKLEKEHVISLLRKLKHLEEMNWKQLAALTREHGLTCENPETESYAMIAAQDDTPGQIAERYYYHFRVDKAFRVFGYQSGPYFFITHLDPNHKVHKG